MEDVKTYLKHYRKYSFDDEKFNEVDNVILSFLSYINFDGIVPKNTSSITVNDAARLFFSKYSDDEISLNIMAIRKAIELLKLMQNSVRFGNMRLYNYAYNVDENSQFGALCCKLDNNTIYISYEGTDSSISGWEEDMKLSYMFPTLSQKQAIDYLNSVVKFTDKNILVGGHSKGGNLAVVSSMYCKPNIRKKIRCIYNNDGPGLRKSEFESQNYKEIKDRIKAFVPKESIVGLVLMHDTNYIVVESKAKGILQHDGTSWACYGGHFITCNLSKNSQRYEENFLAWIKKYDYDKREKFTKSLFDIFRKAGINDLVELKSAKIKGALKLITSTKDIDSDTKDMVLDFLKLLMID